jgi:hypothetical protein
LRPSPRCRRYVLVAQQPVGPHQVLDQHLAVTIDHRQVRAGGKSESASQVPTHHSLLRDRRADDARVTRRQFPHDVGRRIAAAADIVAHQHELIVVDARTEKRFTHARGEGARFIAGAVTEDDNGELRAHGRP